MYRPLVLLALAQMGATLMGFFALGILMKINGYPEQFGVRWNPFAVFLREYGPLFLLFPILWMGYAIPAQRLDKGFFSRDAAMGIGVCFAAGILAAFLLTALFPYTRPLTALHR